MLEINNLILIGKIGKKTEDDFFRFIPIYNADLDNQNLNDLKDVFLIFTDDRVFYVTIHEFKIGNGKIFFKLKENEVNSKIMNSKNVKIMLEPNAYSELVGDYYYPIGKDIIFNNEVWGEVTDWFDNGAHAVLTVKKNTATDSADFEIMIPDVPYYVIDRDAEAITVQNIQSLIAVCE